MDPFQVLFQNELSNQKMHRGDQIQTIHLFMHHLDPAQIAQWDDTQRQVVYRQLFLRAVHDAASGMAACSSAAVAEAIANSELYELTSGYGRRGPHTPPPMDCMTPPPEESFYATALREAYRLSAARSAFYASPLRNLRAGPSTSYLLDYHQILAGKDAFPAFSLESTLAAEHNFQVLPTDDGVTKLPDQKSGENLAQPDPRCLPFFGNEGSFDYPVEDEYEMSYSDESVATLSDEEASRSCSPRDAEKHLLGTSTSETVQGQESYMQTMAADPALDLSKGDCQPVCMDSASCRNEAANLSGSGMGECLQEHRKVNRSIQDLPDELLVRIFSLLSSPETLGLCVALVCKRWLKLSKSPAAWAGVDLHIPVEEDPVAKAQALACLRRAPALGRLHISKLTQPEPLLQDALLSFKGLVRRLDLDSGWWQVGKGVLDVVKRSRSYMKTLCLSDTASPGDQPFNAPDLLRHLRVLHRLCIFSCASSPSPVPQSPVPVSPTLTEVLLLGSVADNSNECCLAVAVLLSAAPQLRTLLCYRHQKMPHNMELAVRRCTRVQWLAVNVASVEVVAGMRGLECLHLSSTFDLSDDDSQRMLHFVANSDVLANLSWLELIIENHHTSARSAFNASLMASLAHSCRRLKHLNLCVVGGVDDAARELLRASKSTLLSVSISPNVTPSFVLELAHLPFLQSFSLHIDSEQGLSVKLSDALMRLMKERPDVHVDANNISIGGGSQARGPVESMELSSTDQPMLQIESVFSLEEADASANELTPTNAVTAVDGCGASPDAVTPNTAGVKSTIGLKRSLREVYAAETERVQTDCSHMLLPNVKPISIHDVYGSIISDSEYPPKKYKSKLRELIDKVGRPQHLSEENKASVSRDWTPSPSSASEGTNQTSNTTLNAVVQTSTTATESFPATPSSAERNSTVLSNFPSARGTLPGFVTMSDKPTRGSDCDGRDRSGVLLGMETNVLLPAES